jgi:hypothetical protein
MPPTHIPQTVLNWKNMTVFLCSRTYTNTWQFLCARHTLCTPHSKPLYLSMGWPKLNQNIQELGPFHCQMGTLTLHIYNVIQLCRLHYFTQYPVLYDKKQKIISHNILSITNFTSKYSTERTISSHSSDCAS